MTARACIFGCEGLSLSSQEHDFFAASQPWGFILFARNISDPEQVKQLTAELRASVGRDAPILIDQEGGRVARMRAPHWKEWLSPLEQSNGLSPQDAAEAVKLRYRLIADELHAVGVDVNCAPMLDIATAQSHAIIHNRCFGTDAQSVASLGRACAQGLLDGGVLPIIKHIPGHGRASLDSHLDLPIVEAGLEALKTVDFAPFAALSDMPMTMTAHIIYPAVDPDNCATESKPCIDLIRSQIGFDGLLMTDDLSMKALQGTEAEKIGRALTAGCDMILHCNGHMDEMARVAAATPLLTGKSLSRADAALSMRKQPAAFDTAAAASRFRELMGDQADG